MPLQDPTLAARGLTGAAEVGNKAVGATASGLGQAAGYAVRGATRPAVWAGRAIGGLAGGSGGGLAKGIGKHLAAGTFNLARRSPLGFALAAPFAITGMKHVGSQATGREGAMMARQIAGSLPVRHGKVAIAFDRSELEQLVKIGKVLKEQEKTAAPEGFTDWKEYAERLEQEMGRRQRRRGGGVVDRLSGKIPSPERPPPPRTTSILGKMLADPKRAAGLAAALTLGSAASALGVQAIGQAVGRTSEKIHGMSQSKQYNKMLNTDPTLKQEPRARQMFNVLHKTSPFLAGDPVLASATVRNMISQGSMVEGGIPNLHPDYMRKLLDIQRGRTDTRFPHIQRAIGATNVSGLAGAATEI